MKVFILLLLVTSSCTHILPFKRGDVHLDDCNISLALRRPCLDAGALESVVVNVSIVNRSEKKFYLSRQDFYFQLRSLSDSTIVCEGDLLVPRNATNYVISAHSVTVIPVVTSIFKCGFDEKGIIEAVIGNNKTAVGFYEFCLDID